MRQTKLKRCVTSGSNIYAGKISLLYQVRSIFIPDVKIIVFASDLVHLCLLPSLSDDLSRALFIKTDLETMPHSLTFTVL